MTDRSLSMVPAPSTRSVSPAGSADAVAQRVIADRPTFHLTDRETSYAGKGTPVRWNAQAETLQFIASAVTDGQRTLEIGSGASTVVFAAAGARHTAISPVVHEHERIADYCEGIGVDTADVTFVADSSDRVLPRLDAGERFDVVFVDGTHAFPYAIVEWHYLRRHLRVGSLLIIDDVPIPSVGVLYEFLRSDPAWERVGVFDRRTVAWRMIAEPREVTWREQAFNDRYPELAFLSPAQRTEATLRHWRRCARNRLARMPRLRAIHRRLRG